MTARTVEIEDWGDKDALDESMVVFIVSRAAFQDALRAHKRKQGNQGKANEDKVPNVTVRLEDAWSASPSLSTSTWVNGNDKVKWATLANVTPQWWHDSVIQCLAQGQGTGDGGGDDLPVRVEEQQAQ